MASLLSKLAGGGGAGSASKQAAQEVAQEQDRRADLLSGLEKADLGWFWQTDASGRLTYISPKASSSLGLNPDELLGKELTDFMATDNSAATGGTSRPLRFRLKSRSPISCLNVEITAANKEVWWEISAGPRLDEQGEFRGLHGTARDVTKALAEAREAEHAAQFDSLTGLANRSRMTRMLESTLSAFKQSKRSVAIMLMDLDRFKKVNDTLGHPAGDELLVQVAERLNRIFDQRGGEIGRLGGDEFQVILPDVDDRGELADLANKMVQMISQPYTLAGTRAIIGCSIGIAVAPYDGIDANELIKSADLALYSAKDSGRGQFKFYSAELSADADFRQRIEDDLRDAIANDELAVHYQPIVDARTHKVACLEALLRWEHPHRGFVSPADFIPVAEEQGLIGEIGEWTLRKVCEDLVHCPPEIRVAVNVSAIQFQGENFVGMVKEVIQDTGVKPSRIELEITESVFVGDLEATIAQFKKLKRIGIRLALDDFGTGYSSLSYLQNAPFDKLKIDQSFVRGCASEDANNGILVAAIVSMASAMGMETVAEGVEAKDEYHMVVQHGANLLQGYLFSGALTLEQLMERFEAGEIEFKPRGPEKYRAERHTEFRKIGLVHGDARYNVILRNISKTGAMIDGLLDVPVDTDVVLDLGGGQLAVATVKRSDGSIQGVEFETPLISNGSSGLCTRHRVSPYQIEAAGRGYGAIDDRDVAAVMGGSGGSKAFLEVDITKYGL
ncbi:GGDEF domain-containing protein [Erythrobacter sp. KY5]|uniref:putative bifunctional diguanylate cyclase/phosphodiesterase n=1 Tax=Erythrobacter sp. KY5 TaxID=2011159 RepID=UPI000DBF2BC9|nr:EAL domain-containing protein [Erythrobacter sp. KY5]AWW74980.1 GGDEF domain-containing protein [Erythrobacter sp. KY5]